MDRRHPDGVGAKIYSFNIVYNTKTFPNGTQPKTWADVSAMATAFTNRDPDGDRIVYGMPDVLGADRARYAGRRGLIVGSGHSASTRSPSGRR